MLDRSIRTRKVIDMKSEDLRALKSEGSLLEKKTLNLVCGLNFNNFQVREIA
jgi:hypothetical protein